MRVRIHDSEVAAAFIGHASLRPDVLVAPAPASRSSAHEELDVGLMGSFGSEERTTEIASLIHAWTTELRCRFHGGSVELVR